MVTQLLIHNSQGEEGLRGKVGKKGATGLTVNNTVVGVFVVAVFVVVVVVIVIIIIAIGTFWSKGGQRVSWSSWAPGICWTRRKGWPTRTKRCKGQSKSKSISI